MPRACTCCTHKERAAIDTALLESQPLRHIAAQFNVSTGALQRHRDHITPALAKAQEARAIASADTLLDQVKSLQSEAKSILEEAKNTGDLKTALSAIGQARACLELLAKLTGELASQPVVNVTVSTEWLELRTVIVNALQPFPEARTAVSLALEGTNP
jgi:hypothetical protein